MVELQRDHKGILCVIFPTPILPTKARSFEGLRGHKRAHATSTRFWIPGSEQP